MNEHNEIVKLAVDAYHGTPEKYSVNQSMDVLHEALVAANGGSTILNYKNIRDGKCVGLFSIVEEILSRTVIQGIQDDNYVMSIMEMRNVAAGDLNEFVVEDNDVFFVSEAAQGTQGIRRQRLGGATKVSIPTSFHVVKIYEELNRVLSGQVDFNKFIQKVGESFRRDIRAQIYALWSGATQAQLGGAAYRPTAGTFDEDALLTLIEHVEAAAGGKPATIIGTKMACRKLVPSIVGDAQKDDLYNMGYAGKFYGSNVVAVPQLYKVNSTDFVMDDNMLAIIAGDEKPIKMVVEGDATMLMGDPMANADLTHEYLYGERMGLGLVLANGNPGIGIYEMT